MYEKTSNANSYISAVKRKTIEMKKYKGITYDNEEVIGELLIEDKNNYFITLDNGLELQVKPESVKELGYYDDNTRVSNSAIGWFLQKGPLYFIKRLLREIQGETSQAMSMGTAIHMYLLQPEEFKKTYKVKTIETPKSEHQKQFCIEYINSKRESLQEKALEAYSKVYAGKPDIEKALIIVDKLDSYIEFLGSKDKDKVFLSTSQSNQIKEAARVVSEHKIAHKLLWEVQSRESSEKDAAGFEVVAENEFHINWEYNGVKCKSLLDRVIINHKKKHFTLIDIKTTGNIEQFKKSIDEFDYNRQMAFYVMALQHYLREKGVKEEYTFDVKIIAIQSFEAARCRVFNIKEERIREKIETIKTTIEKLKWHLETNLWDNSKEYYTGDGIEEID